MPLSYAAFVMHWNERRPQALYRREPVVEEVPVALAVHRDERVAEVAKQMAAEADAGRGADDDDDDDRGRSKRGVMEAQLSLPQVGWLPFVHRRKGVHS